MLSKSTRTITSILGAAAWCVSLAGTVQPLHAENNGAAKTPPMGWSSWSFLRNNPTEANIEAQAKAMQSSGLANAGYVYINIDDFYYLNPASTVDAYGRWVIDPNSFPNGMKAVGDYIHSLGLKFGMYVTPGVPVAAYNQNTPIEGTSYHAQDIVSDTSHYEANYHYYNVMYFIDWGKPGAQAFLNSWAKLLASYGVDYLKIDGVGDGDAYDVSGWSQALQNSGRTIHLELSNNLDINHTDIWKTFSNGWRIDNDIENYGGSTLTTWQNVSFRFNDAANGWAYYSGPGGWSDLDSLELGNGNNDGLTVDERQTAATLWSIVAAPLLLGSDLTNLDSGDLKMMTNPEVIAINQAGVQGSPLAYSNDQEVWRARQPSGAYAVALFNRNNPNGTGISVNWASMGFTGSATVRDLWSRTDLGTFNGSYSTTLNNHASKFLLVTPQTPAAQYLADSAANSLGGGAKIQPIIFSNGTSNSNVTTNGAAVGFVGNGGTLTFNNVTVSTAGTYNVTVLYLNGDSSRNASISVNGGAANNYSFTGTGSFTALGTKTIQLQLAAGANTIAFSNPSGYAPDFDSITVQQTSTPSFAGTRAILNKKTGQAVDNNNTTALGAGVVQWTPNGNNTQKWTFTQNPDATWKITNVLSGDVLEDPNSATDNNTQMDQWVANGGANQKWQVIQLADGTYEILNQASGKVLDGSSNSTNGYKLIQFDWNNGDQQHWKLQ